MIVRWRRVRVVFCSGERGFCWGWCPPEGGGAGWLWGWFVGGEGAARREPLPGNPSGGGGSRVSLWGVSGGLGAGGAGG